MLEDYEVDIEYWHTEYQGDLALHEFLGLSWLEYGFLIMKEDIVVSKEELN